MKRRALLFVAVVLAGAAALRAEDREITLVNIKYQGNVIWLPNPLIVREGDRVTLTLVNNVPDEPSIHGFSIPVFGVKANVARAEPQKVVFTASKAGLFETNCHLHPAHVRGQILVLSR